jgi:hypothetical protein
MSTHCDEDEHPERSQHVVGGDDSYEGIFMTRRFRGGWFALALTAALGVLILGSSVAQAAGCPGGSDVWNGSGLWSSAGGWSTGQVPQSQTNYEPNVCIQSGTVALTYETQVNSISVMSGATLDIYGEAGYTHGLLTLTNQDAGVGIAAGGTANFGYYGVPTDNGYETHGGFDSLSGTLVNDGSITSAATGDETPNLLEGNFDNAGTLTIDNTLDGQLGTWTLGGTVNNTAGQLIALTTPGTGSVNLTATITNSGTFTIGDGINVTATSGTASGNPIVLGNGVLSPSGTGSAEFHIEDGGAQLGSNIASGYTVWGSGVPGYTHGNLTPTGSYTNYGTLELGSTDGTHGTLTVPSGDTFTNAGSLIFENTANGPDGLSGALVNNGTVSAENQFQGSGAITNNGTMELTAASGQSSATSFTQSSKGTLLLDVTGGGSAIVPGLQLTGAASLGGSLKVVTTGGKATGTFPAISASTIKGAFGTSFSGENYSLKSSAGTLSLTGPASTTVAAGIKMISGGNGSFSVKLTCAKGKTCAGDTVTATIAETKRVHGKSKTVTEVVAKKVEKVASGRSKTLTIPISNSLLDHGPIKVLVTIASGKKKIKSATVTVKPAKKRKK